MNSNPFPHLRFTIYDLRAFGLYRARFGRFTCKSYIVNRIFLVFFLLASWLCRAQTTVVFTNATMVGTTNDTTITIKADNNPIIFNGVFYSLPPTGTNITTTNGVGQVALVPGSYTASFAGVPAAFKLYVTNSAAPLNAASIASQIIFYSGVQSLTAAGGVSIYPPTGSGGNWTISNPPASSFDLAGAAATKVATNGGTSWGQLAVGLALSNLNPGAASMPLGVTAAGQVTTNGVPGGGGGGGAFPLSADANFAGFSGTNANNLNATNEVSYGISSPFPTATRHVFDGNSRVSGFGNPWPHWPGILYSNLIPQSHVAGYYNLGVAGQTVEQDSANYASVVHPLRPAGGTNAWLYWEDSINDAYYLTNIQTTINNMSNILYNAKLDGFTLVVLTAWEDAGLTQSQLALLAQQNDYCLTNIFADYVVDVRRTMSFNTWSVDGLHPNAIGDTNIAKLVWATILDNRGSARQISQEGHFANYLDLYSSGDIVNVRGRSTTASIASDYPSIVFDAGSFGGCWIGEYAGAFNVWVSGNSGNIPALNGMSISPASAQIVPPLSINTNASTPAPLSQYGTFYLSNYDLYWVTPNKTNLIVLGH